MMTGHFIGEGFDIGGIDDGFIFGGDEIDHV